MFRQKHLVLSDNLIPPYRRLYPNLSIFVNKRDIKYPPKQEQRNYMQYWLVKSEPVKYSWDKFVQDGRTFWDGVRNYQARNNLREMKEGDLTLYYHSNEGKAVVGIAKIVREAYQDPTTEDPNWVVVDLSPVEALKRPVTLEEIKADDQLKDIGLVRQGRLSVMALKATEFDRIIELGNS